MTPPADAARPKHPFRVSRFGFRFSLLTLFLAGVLLASPARAADKLDLPPEATQGLRLLYSGDPDAAIEDFRKIEQKQSDHPLGYVLEANALWWKIYCATCEIKWNTIDAWHRPRLREDDAYLNLADKAVRLAEARIARQDTAEMRLYAGMGWGLRARLLGLRDDRRGTAKAGVRARAHVLRCIQLDPDMADAYTVLGLYNYYVDTLSGIAKILRAFMGIPGGNKREGLRQLERGMTQGEVTGAEARLYLAKNLRNYDQKYEQSIEVLAPLVKQYPANPLFQLLLGDTYAKLSRKEQAAASFHAAEKLKVNDPACRARVEQVARTALAALSEKTSQSSSREALAAPR